jgi:endonuclease-3
MAAMNIKFPINPIMQALKRAVEGMRVPIVTEYSRDGADPFRILISTVLSLRTKDETTAAASARLFALAKTPEAMLRLDEGRIAREIFPVGFYKTKARTIRRICQVLIERHGGRVPDDLDELLKLNGVGRKTANLVLTLGFGKPGICVDTHVHRITNRWGLVATRTPEQTEMALRRLLPARYWIPINDWLVAYGQQVCRPVSPRCSVCALRRWCGRLGVDRSR